MTWKRKTNMLKTLELAEQGSNVDFVHRGGKKYAFKNSISVQIGNLADKSYARVPFALSHYDEGKTLRTISIEPSDDDMQAIDAFDKALKLAATEKFPDDATQWHHAVAQEGNHRPRVTIKINCMKNPLKATQFFTWDGETYTDDGKPILKPGTIADIAAGAEVVTQVDIASLWSFRDQRGFTMYANSICVIPPKSAPREVTFL
jgi:hypothetical protein